jgi:hypothetical protein
MLSAGLIFFIFCVGSSISVEDYIVSLVAPSDDRDRVSHLTEHINFQLQSVLNGDYHVKHIYSHMAVYDFLAYSIRVDSEGADVIKNMPGVKFIEPVGYMDVAGVRKIGNTVSFDPQYVRPEIPTLTKDGFCNVGYDTYYSFVDDFNVNPGVSDVVSSHTSHSSTVFLILHVCVLCQNVFVLDTGIQATHKAFGGRVEHGLDVVNPQQPLKTDPHGHGTQVAGDLLSCLCDYSHISALTNIIAGIIGGSEQGVAKNVHLVDVRVMDNTGRGYVDDIMAGLNYVVGKHSTCILHMIRMS